MYAFNLIREKDETGISGTGKVLEGVIFDDGETVVRWCVKGKPNSTVIWKDFESFKHIHIDSHPNNESKIVWLYGEYKEKTATDIENEAFDEGWKNRKS